jgi:hypothetical protein
MAGEDHGGKASGGKPSGGSPSTAEGGTGKPILYAGIAGTAAFGVGTLVMGILAVRKHGIYTDETQPVDARRKAQDKGQTYAYVTDGLLAATVAAGAFTTYWYFYVYKPNREWAAPGTAARPGTQILPYAAEDGGGVLVQGAF